jgi:aryl carrier-like protein
LELLPRTRLINTYGPAEATIVATSSDLGAWLAAGAAEAPPIGTPWPGMETDLVDGELWLGGARIANGYLGRDDLTRERFRERDGVRWYRTGDRATRRADGQLIFAGRNDDQVKVRGHRIELGEVEAQLAAEPGVARAAALAPAGDDGVRRLVAFIEPAPGATPQPATLAAALRARLPPYLVPSALRVVARLPLSPNGKVDRAVLAADAARLIVGDAADALLAAFRRAAAAPELDEDDDVFAAGADSLAALGLALDLSRASGRMVTVTDLVRQPTPRAMRAFLAGAAAAATPIPVLPSAANVPAMLVTLRQCRTWAWFGWVATGSSEPYVVGCHLWLSGALDVHALVRAWRRVVARHEPLRVCLPPLAGWRARWPRWAQAALVLNPLCRWVFLRITAQRHRRAAPGELPPTMQVPLADVPLLQAEAAERACVEERPLPDRAPDAVRALLLAHMAEPLREDQAPLARLRLYRAGDGGAHLLSLVVHHGVADGESTVWLKRDLLAFYADELGAGAPPPPLPLAWGDLARWRREQPSTAVVTGWRRLFATCDGDPTLVLPCWRGTPPARAWRRRAALLTAMLDPAASARLRRLAQEQRATLFMVALAGMAAVVRRQVAREVLPIRGALANRERPEAAELCACLTEPAIFAVRADPAATFAGQIEAARQAVLASLALQGAPVETYAALMECTFAQGRLRMRDGNDYPGVFVDVRNGGRGDRAVAGLQVHELHLPEPECDGDLQCTLVDHGDAGIEAWCQFSDDRWDEAGVRSFFTGWLNLLAHAEPGTACAALAERAAGAAPPMISRHALRKRNA